jgi:hypothetical protein
VAAPWKQAFWIGYSVFWVGLLAYVRVIKPWLELRRPYVVEEVRKERGDAWTLTLRPEGHAGMTFHPGQFAWLTLRNSPFADREHPFSFSSSAARPGELAFTIKERGDFTRQIGQVRPGARVPGRSARRVHHRPARPRGQLRLHLRPAADDGRGGTGAGRTESSGGRHPHRTVRPGVGRGGWDATTALHCVSDRYRHFDCVAVGGLCFITNPLGARSAMAQFSRIVERTIME